MSFKKAAKNANAKASGKKNGSKKGMGFKAAAEQVRKKGKGKYSKEAANAIVAAASRGASAAAKKKNPRLNRVK